MRSEPAALAALDDVASDFFAGHYGSAQKRRGLGALLRTTYGLAPEASVAIALRFLSRPRPCVELPPDSDASHGWSWCKIPFEARRLAVFQRMGTAGRPLVLMVHGWGGNAVQMHAIANVLADAGFCPTLVDLPAHGESGAGRSSVAQFSRALFALQAWCGRFHGVVAHSAGALASAYAVTRALAVERLVLIAAPSSPSCMVASVAVAFGLPDSWTHRMIERLGHQGGVCLSEFDLETMAPHISLPTLLVHDEADRVAPITSSRRIASLLVDGDLFVTEGLGHRRLLQNPGVASRVLCHMSSTTAA